MEAASRSGRPSVLEKLAAVILCHPVQDPLIYSFHYYCSILLSLESKEVAQSQRKERCT